LAVSGTYILQLNSGTSPGPYTIYADTIDSNPVEMNVSATRLRNSVICTVTPQPTQFIIVNNNPACNNHYIVSVSAPAPPPTPTATGTPNPSPTMTPTITATNTQTSTPTPSPTNTPTIAPTLTPTLTATSTPAALVSVTVNLTIDAGNTGYTQIYYPSSNGGSLILQRTLTSTSTTTFNVPSGNRFYVITLQQSRAYAYQLSEIIYSINGVPDANSPYLKTLNVANELISIPTYGGDGHPIITYGNTYVVDTYIGNQR
jgi:hypothetical protein